MPGGKTPVTKDRMLYNSISILEMSRIGGPTDTESRIMGFLGQGHEGGGQGEVVNANGYSASLGSNENVLKLIVVMLVKLREYVKNH